ncbi:MAG: N-acetylmuramoyl-L-alanine amidase [Alphaproteobacteria bacterium]|nr:N-acetylmuramoyl-L-alanine amidase [Alphaproteobacteria bacterium]
MYQKIIIGLGAALCGVGSFFLLCLTEDSALPKPVMTYHFSSHYEEREQPISHIVIHSFALPVSEMIDRLDTLNVSTHYLIDKKGNIIQLVPDDKVAWHAGKSYWRGVVGLNATSIGVELQNDTLGQTAFSDKQIDSCARLLIYLIQKYQIESTHIVSHSDIAPARKVDVGKAFPWEKMAEWGIGIWGNNDVNDGPLIMDEARLLSDIGYDVTDLDKALLAFERRYMPDLIPDDSDINHLEENLVAVQPIRNQEVIKRLNAVARAFRIK